MRKTLLALGAFGSRSRLRGRIEALLAHGRAFLPSVSPSRAAASAAVLLTLTIGAPFAPRWISYAPLAYAQPEAGAVTQRFEVASIKPCDPAAQATGGRGAQPSSASLRLICNTVVQLIPSAYDTNADSREAKMIASLPISGGPSWINSDRYTILAKAEDASSQPMMRGPMLRALLEDRFQLRVRREVREVPVYNLTTAKGGSKLKASREGSCPTPNPAAGSCPGSIWVSKKGSEVVTDQQDTLAGFIRMLSQRVGRPVIDKTGINGTFDFHLEYTPDETTGGTTTGVEAAGQTGVFPDPAGPSIFTAVQEQLGLKLESARGPGEFLVVERIERPSEN